MFEKDFFKLMSNAAFRKIIAKLRKYRVAPKNVLMFNV